MGENELAGVLARLQRWKPFDGDALLEDVAAVLDDVVPAEDSIGDLAERLRGHVKRLVDIALATEADQDDVTCGLIEQAQAVGALEVTGDSRAAVGVLRRMAWAVNELHERLGVMQCLKEVA